MLLTSKSITDFIETQRSRIYANNSLLNAENHSVIYDTFLYPSAVVTSQLYNIQVYVDALHALDVTKIETDTALRDSLKEFFTLTEDELTAAIKEDFNQLAETYSLTRIEGIAAKGYVRFFFQNNSAISIPAGTRISTKATPIISFDTVNAVVNHIPTFDSNTGLYYADVAVDAVAIGTSGNLPPNRINRLDSTVTGVVSVNNVVKTVGGMEEETNQELATRISIRRAGRSIPTIRGYYNLIVGSGLVRDAFIATKREHPELVTRNEANAMDVFVITSQVGSTTLDTIPVESAVFSTSSRFIDGQQQTFPPSYDPSDEIEIPLRRQPVNRIVAVTRDSVPVSESEYSLEKDTTGVKKSTRAFDKVKIDSQGTTLVIQYEYDLAIADIQNLLDADENKIANSNILVRQAEEVPLNIEIPITTYADVDAATVKANVEANLEKFFSGGTTTYGTTFVHKKLGERVDVSDVLNVILNTEGVDRLQLPNFKLTNTNSENEVQNLNANVITGSTTPGVNEYFSLGTITWI